MAHTDVPRARIRLADGRGLSYAEAGPRDGFPVVYLHGAIGSPLTCDAGLAGALDDLGMRLLMPARPGFGDSDPQPGRVVADHARDVEELADALGLCRFAVVGVSAGGPYAIACAARLAERLTAAAAVSSLSPVCSPAYVPELPARIRLPLRALAAAPGTATRAGDALIALAARRPALTRRVVCLAAPPAGGRELRGDATPSTAIAALLTAASGGVAGLVADHLLTTRAWGLDLGAVAGEVHLWHGMQDPLVPVEHTLQLTAALPRCRMWLEPGEGHFFFRRRVREILAALRQPAGVRSIESPANASGGASS